MVDVKPIMNKFQKIELEFRRFESSHYPVYEKWFEDDKIKTALYGIDQEWLDFVLNDASGIEYAVFRDGEMVAVVGIELPTSKHPIYAIKNIAVSPMHQGRGIGSVILKKLLKIHPIKAEEQWIAFVEEKNTYAYHFFIRNGWKEEKIESGMIKFIGS